MTDGEFMLGLSAKNSRVSYSRCRDRPGIIDAATIRAKYKQLQRDFGAV